MEKRLLAFALGSACIVVPLCGSPKASQGGSLASFKTLLDSPIIAAHGALLSRQFRPRKMAQIQPQPQIPIAPASPPPPAPHRTEILRFDNWVVTCNEFEPPKKRVCDARLQFVNANTNQLLLEWTFWLNDNKQVQARLQTPTGVNIPAGVDVQPEKGPARKLAFESCEAGFCFASMVMDANLVRDLSASTIAELTIQASNGNSARFNLQIKGIGKALAALRK